MSNNKISICFIVQYLSIGGIESRLLSLLARMDSTKFDITILCAEDSGLLNDKIKQTGFPVIVTKGLTPISRLIQFSEFCMFFMKRRFRRFDVVCSFLGTSIPFEIFVGKLACKHGGFVYALVNKERMGRKIDWVRREKYSARIISISKQLVQYHCNDKITKNKARIIYNGIDLNKFKLNLPECFPDKYGLPQGKVIFAYVARVSPEKGHFELLKAIQNLPVNSRKLLHIAIAGQDKLDGKLQQEILDLGLSSTVSYLGPIYDVPCLLSVCDGLILASPREGCGTAVLEGMAMGLPVISTASGAEEFVQEGLTGIVVPVGDTNALSDAIDFIAHDSEIRISYGHAGRKWIEQYCTVERMVKDYENIFLEVSQTVE